MTLLTPQELHQWRMTYPHLWYVTDTQVMEFAENKEAIQRYHNEKWKYYNENTTNQQQKAETPYCAG
jgi:hypothetical protein